MAYFRLTSIGLIARLSVVGVMGVMVAWLLSSIPMAATWDQLYVSPLEVQPLSTQGT